MTEPHETEPGAVATGFTPETIVAAARFFIGTPFRHQGQDAETGLDCRGLLLVVGNRIGYRFTREYANDYQVHPDPDSQAFARKAAELLLALETEFERHPASDTQSPSTIVHVNFPREPAPTHCGIIAASQHEPTIIHALGTDHGGAVIEEPLHRWEPYIVAAYSWKGVE